MGKPKPDFTLDDVKKRVLGEGGQIYLGPLAYTATEYAKSWGRDKEFVRGRLEESVESGTMIKVILQRIDSMKRPYYPYGYTPIETYEAYISQKEHDAGDNLG